MYLFSFVTKYTQPTWLPQTTNVYYTYFNLYLMSHGLRLFTCSNIIKFAHLIGVGHKAQPSNLCPPAAVYLVFRSFITAE